MDVNETKFHLLLGRADWGRCHQVDGRSLAQVWKDLSEGKTDAENLFHWNMEKGEILLRPRLFRFDSRRNGKKTADKPDLSKRRGAARDRYGNWYWIDETGTKIRVLSVGSNRVTDFYPAAGKSCSIETAGDFQPVEDVVSDRVVSFQGLAITSDHYLVVGTIEPAGLLIFDLFSSGEPRRILWRDDIEFSPFDMAARPGGGVFVLDRENQRFWTLDYRFTPIGESPSITDDTAEHFQPFESAGDERRHSENLAAENFFVQLAAGKDPISIEALPDGTVLVLYRAAEDEDSEIQHYSGAAIRGNLSIASIRNYIEEDAEGSPSVGQFFLRAFDFAFVPGIEGETSDRLFIVSEEGNQSFAFGLSYPENAVGDAVTDFTLVSIGEYFPMRLFGGKGYASADGMVYYDFGERWLPLIAQKRPGYIGGAILDTPVFDGKKTDCVWHRLMLDGCIPPETEIEVYSRSASVEGAVQAAAWKKEPDLFLRGKGSEIPYSNGTFSKEQGTGTWELLIQRTKDRFLQLRLVFSGNQQRTPRLTSLRVYYPRFSYLENYLPGIYRDEPDSASFLDRFLANFEGFYTDIEGRMAAAQMLFDVRSAPADALDWLAGWFGIALEPGWDEDKRRLFISRAVEFYQIRGTMRGLRAALHLLLSPCADESIFIPQTAKEKLQDPIRIVERFLTRRTPRVIPGEFNSSAGIPRLVEQSIKWRPGQGADVLHRRYSEKFQDQPNLRFPLIRPEDEQSSGVWEGFATEALGFVPSGAAALERNKWQGFLRAEYLDAIGQLNQAHDKNFGGFDEIFLPTGTENNAAAKQDWRAFIAETASASRNRRLWQDFLARRYRRIGQLNSQYLSGWSSFESVSLFDQIPLTDVGLSDWFVFESAVLAMHRTAHRFTVLIPAATAGGFKAETTQEQQRRLELVRRVVEMEKPAHTVFDFRYYWNLFRVEEVRLGLDTLLGLGSRDPQLSPELTIGEGFVGESRIGTLQPEKYASRYVLGSENLINRQKKDEKP